MGAPVTATEERTFLLWLATKAKESTSPRESGETTTRCAEVPKEAPAKEILA